MDRRDKLLPRNVDELHRLLAEVMVRNRRSTVGLALTRRIAKTHIVTLSDPERALYDDVSRFVRQHLNVPSDGKSKRALWVTQGDEMRFGDAAREREPHRRAAIAYHHLAKQAV